MTASELGDLEALVGKILPDPRGFAERVLEQVLDRLSTAGPGPDGSQVVVGLDVAAHQALRDQNLLLAAALGACDCWGHDAGCPICSGQGSPGWTLPDPALYAEYVTPASVRLAAKNGPTDAEQQE